MKVYKLRYVVLAPGEDWNDEDDKYVAEIPLLPGCRAWGDTPEQAIEYLRGNAVAFIESIRAHGEALAPEVEAMAMEVELGTEEVLVAV